MPIGASRKRAVDSDAQRVAAAFSPSGHPVGGDGEDRGRAGGAWGRGCPRSGKAASGSARTQGVQSCISAGAGADALRSGTPVRLARVYERFAMARRIFVCGPGRSGWGDVDRSLVCEPDDGPGAFGIRRTSGGPGAVCDGVLLERRRHWGLALDSDFRARTGSPVKFVGPCAVADVGEYGKRNGRRARPADW